MTTIKPLPILSFNFLAYDSKREEFSFTELLLAKEGEGYIWRVGGESGDECETLPRPCSVSEALADAHLYYPNANWSSR